MKRAFESNSTNSPSLTRDAWRHVFSYLRLFPRLKVVALVCKNWHALVLESITDLDDLAPTQAFLERHLPRLTSLTSLKALPVLIALRDWSMVPPLLHLTHLQLIEHASPTYDAWTLRLPSLVSLSLPNGVVHHLDALAACVTGLLTLELRLSSHLAAFRAAAPHLTSLTCSFRPAMAPLIEQGIVYPHVRRLELICVAESAEPLLSLLTLFPSLTELSYDGYVPGEASDVWDKCAPLFVQVGSCLPAPSPLPRLEVFADHRLDDWSAPDVVAFLAMHSTSLHFLELKVTSECQVHRFPPCALPRLRALEYDPWISWNFLLEGRFPRLTRLLIRQYDVLPLKLLNRILDRRDRFPLLEDIEACGAELGARMNKVTEFLDKAERAGLRRVKLSVCEGRVGDWQQRVWMRASLQTLSDTEVLLDASDTDTDDSNADD